MIRTWGRILLRDMRKNKQIQFFWPTNVFFSDLNIMNMKVFCNLAAMYLIEKKLKKYSWEINPLGVHRYMREKPLKLILKD